MGCTVVRWWMRILAYPEWLWYLGSHSTFLQHFPSVFCFTAMVLLVMHWTLPGSFRKIPLPWSYPPEILI